jgi:hypothetical protein
MANKSKKKESVNPVMAGVTGALLGGAAVAAAMTLSNEKKREEIKDTLNEAKDKAQGYWEEVQDKKEEIEDKLTESKEKVEKTADAVKKSFK